MINRFQGKDGKRRLSGLLADQVLVAGDTSLASEIADRGELIESKAGNVLIEQGGSDNDAYLIVAGACEVSVNGRTVATRRAGTHVGEMALVQPSQRRAATVTSTEDTVLVRLSEPLFTELGESYPSVWRQMAKEMARRLEQRNALVTSTHDRIRVFIMSSAESLPIARAIQDALERDPFFVVVWTDGVFRASSYPLESLEAELDQSDFAIAVAHADDVTLTRGKEWPTTRDNVVFELGFFMGRLGKARSFLVERRGEEVKLPSDLLGLTTLAYRWSGDQKELSAAIAPVANRLRQIFSDLGPNN